MLIALVGVVRGRRAADRSSRPTPPPAACGCRPGCCSAAPLGNLIDRLVRAAASPTSSSCRSGRRSTSPTSRSPSACCRLLYVLEGRRAMRVDVPAEAAGERLDVFLAGPLGSRAAAQRLIDAGRVTVDGEARAQAPRAARRRADRGRRARSAAPAAAVPDARVRDRLRGRATCSWSTSPRASSCTRRAGTARARSPRRSSAAAPAARTRSGRDRPPPRPRHVRAARRRALGGRPSPRCRRSSRRAAIQREYLALVEGRPPARTGTIDAPLGRDRRVRTRMSTDTDDAARGGHALRDRGGAAEGRTLLRVRARDRPHAPDPRPPEGDRPSRSPAIRTTARRRARARAPVPARRRGSPSPTRSRARASTCARRCPTDLAAALTQ